MTKTPHIPAFTREATGLVRSISPWTMLWASMGEIGFGTGLLLMNDADSFLPSGNPGGNVVIASIIFLVIVLFEAYLYNTITVATRRAGGDYVCMSRNIYPALASILIYGFIFTGFPFTAISLNWMFTLSLLPSMSTIGVVTGNSGLISLSSALGTPVSLAVVSLILLAVFTAVDIVWPKQGFMSLGLFALLGTVGTLVMAAVFLAAGPSGIQSSVANLLLQNNATYTSIASQYTGPSVSLPAIILLFPFLYFTLPFINNTADFSGEARNIKRSAFTGTILAALLSGVLLIVLLQMYYSYLGFNFAMQAPSSWPSSLAAAGIFPNMLTIATIAAKDNVALMWIMNVLFALWYLASVQQSLIGISRYIFAVSFDRLLPIKLANVSDRFHSPVTAILLESIVTVPMILFVSFTSWLSLFSTTAASTIFFTFIGITGIVYAWKKRESLKNTSIWLIISGAIVFCFFLYMTYMVLVIPYYGINTPTWALLLGVWILGALAYPISKAYYGRQGLDIRMVFKELPPE
jgi:amino acid transporter